MSDLFPSLSVGKREGVIRAAPWWVAMVICLVSAGTYFLTRSPALDEWDSVQFAMGVGEFNLWKHQPHPPGYPLYLAVGWLAERCLGCSAQEALALGSALGGGWFVAGWFVLIARRFPRPVAVLSTLALAVSVNTWMNATKVLTDPLAAGLLTLALVFLDQGAASPTVRGRRGFLALGALTAAGAAGARPQNVGILLLIVVLATARETRRAEAARWGQWWHGPGVFAVGCFAWVVPTMVMQARVTQPGGQWWAYGSQLVGQWRWRLDQPRAFVGAAGPGGGMWYRLNHHVLGWFTRGFGFPLESVAGWLGVFVIVAGWGLCVWQGRRNGRPGELALEDRAGAEIEQGFWRMHLPWAAAYGVMIFCCLPGDQRYYLPIFPLFIVAAVAGWWGPGRGPWRWAAVGVPVAVGLATAPLVGPNHREEAPPVRIMRALEERYPAPAQQAQVWLILRDSRRHAEWYAPGFHTFPMERFAPGNPPEGFPQAREVYTDDPSLRLAPPPDFGGAMHWRLVWHFERSPIIYRKHNEANLYRWETVATLTN